MLYPDVIAIFNPETPYTGANTCMGVLGNDEDCMQYIGIKDKTGKEIYEKDIVKYSWNSGENEVEHDVGEIFFEEAIYYISKQDRFSWNDWNLRKDSIEIIGNTYENPELL